MTASACVRCAGGWMGAFMSMHSTPPRPFPLPARSTYLTVVPRCVPGEVVIADAQRGVVTATLGWPVVGVVIVGTVDSRHTSEQPKYASPVPDLLHCTSGVRRPARVVDDRIVPASRPRHNTDECSKDSPRNSHKPICIARSRKAVARMESTPF